jgi:hypothetical protein
MKQWMPLLKVAISRKSKNHLKMRFSKWRTPKKNLILLKNKYNKNLMLLSKMVKKQSKKRIRDNQTQNK